MVATTSAVKYLRPAHVDATIQHEKAYQRQEAVNENSRAPNKRRVNRSGHIRYWKNVGLGFKTPKTAINGRYIDKKCPFTGNVSIRGRILRGIVHSTKMHRSIVIRRNYLHFIQKYQRYQKRHKNFAVHCSPAFEPKVGDDVIVGQCRPLSKTIRYNVLEVIAKTSADKAGKKFAKN
jgi:small subunit ribosomal protein S11e